MRYGINNLRSRNSAPLSRLAVPILSALALPWLTWAETAEWPRFRGPNGGGAIEAGTLPVEVGLDRNLLWRAGIPAGDSSPVLSADRHPSVLTGKALRDAEIRIWNLADYWVERWRPWASMQSARARWAARSSCRVPPPRIASPRIARRSAV